MLNIHEAQNKFISAFGVNHQTANVATREKIAFRPEELQALLPRCVEALGVSEVALLSTCNRTEFYAIAEAEPDWLSWLAREKKLDPTELSAYCFEHHNRPAIRHIFRVACGLDSLVLGEPQILGQMKQAYRLAKAAGTLHSVLDRLFQQAFAIAKQVRHNTAIGQNPVSVAYAGVKLTRQFFDDHPKRTALIVGSGETAKLTARYLRDLQIGRLLIANRTLAHAQSLAEENHGFALSLEQIDAHLHEADMVFGTARVERELIGTEQVERALRARRQLQIYVDLAIPRNFAAGIEGLEEAFSFTIDDLEQIIEGNRQARKQASSQAEIMVNLHSDDFLGWFLSKPQQQIVRHMREHANELRLQLLNEAYRRLALGEEASKVMEQLSLKLMNKLLHNPSELIHAIPPDHKDWLAIVADTFQS